MKIKSVVSKIIIIHLIIFNFLTLEKLYSQAHAPIYTTYAAAIERSEYILDEGYRFRYDQPDRGIDFITDTAGDICLAFKSGADIRYYLADMHQAPIISFSYPDMIRYYYYPFKGLRVEVTFFVFSSRISLLDVRLTNEDSSAMNVSVYPFLHNEHRTFENVILDDEKGQARFLHKEFPDSWTLEHHIPYIDTVSNIFMLSEKPDRIKSFRSLSWEEVNIPQQINLYKKQKYVIWGKLTHENGERCRHSNPQPQILLYLNGNRKNLLTQAAPRWEKADPNISAYGYYHIELGNFQNLREGDRFDLRALCPITGESGSISGKVENLDSTNSRRIDLTLSKKDVLAPPQHFSKDAWGSGKEIRLYWKCTDPDLLFHVYRRNYRKSGFYTCIAQNLQRTFYTDKNIDTDAVYGYLVLSSDSAGYLSMPTPEITNITASDFFTDIKYPDQIKTYVPDFVRVISMTKEIKLLPGASTRFRISRGCAPTSDKLDSLAVQIKSLFETDINLYIQENEQLFSRIPEISTSDNDIRNLYKNAFYLMSQVFLPPEGQSPYNYYVFSREPTWGWGHGGQVFHESLTMLAYAVLDPQSAMNSQRVFSDRQREDGYINYRTGPYLDETIPVDGEWTSSAPWYNWINYEIYRITQDKGFLEEMYNSGKLYYEYMLKNRDKDHDGLCEWGAHAVLESVRDARVAVWDEVDWPSHFEALDMNCMLVREARSLSQMALILSKDDEYKRWEEDAKVRTERINGCMWDEGTGFYYHVDKSDDNFTYKEESDLKRQEIIGFLPLWAGIADSNQADILVHHLTDPEKFWRTFGVPSLTADDPYYNPKGYWNGPVWVQWNYLIVRGLLDYGYVTEARELTQRVAQNMIACLKKDHTFWEFYSPDEVWGGYHHTYIWAGIIARMLFDVYEESFNK